MSETINNKPLNGPRDACRAAQTAPASMAQSLTALQSLLGDYGSIAVAVSGGVDSMTLAAVAAEVLGDQALMVHALSPAVPPEASVRVLEHARRLKWSLKLVEAGEFADSRYRSNPVNRCYYCKSNLYERLREVWDGTIASGANTDDLGDYRPGLLAASERQVVHPLVEAGIDKATVRLIASHLRLNELSELPAQPCLSSRIETGIAIDASDLQFVHRIEQFLNLALGSGDHRCRITAAGVRIEISDDDLHHDDVRLGALHSELERRIHSEGRQMAELTRYQRGSAFVHAPQPD